tara:strand:- start:502 stop:798 length:297 start_codon:yes stop_codon:yes gene_type:complete
MRIELKEFIERVVEDLIRKDDDLGLPIQSTWERIYYEFEDFMEEVEESYFEEELEEIFGRIHTMKEIKEYTMECFYDVLEKYEMEKEIFEMKYRNEKI